MSEPRECVSFKPFIWTMAKSQFRGYIMENEWETRKKLHQMSSEEMKVKKKRQLTTEAIKKQTGHTVEQNFIHFECSGSRLCFEMTLPIRLLCFGPFFCLLWESCSHSRVLLEWLKLRESHSVIWILTVTWLILPTELSFALHQLARPWHHIPTVLIWDLQLLILTFFCQRIKVWLHQY